MGYWLLIGKIASITAAGVIDFMNRYDNIANTMGVSSQCFVDMHKDKVDELKRLLINYVNSLRQTANILAARQPSTPSHNLDLRITNDGYPILPTLPFQNLNKNDITHLIRTYLNAHYSKLLETRIWK